jgi:hypothetical protein
MKRLLFVAACLFVAASLGCGGDSSGRQAVSGKITLKGQLLDEGTINFSARPPGEGFAGALIQKGEYSIPAEQGLLPGSYEVRISSPEKGSEQVAEAPGIPGPPAQDRVPAAYNAATTLSFDVKTGDDNHYNFDIP